MADSSAAPSSAPRSRVVRSLARAAERPCARPGCPAPARATLTFSYGTAEVHLDRLVDEVDPQGYDLCARHAARTEAPRGWGLTDRRPPEDRVVDEPAVAARRDLGSQATVAVLAAALRAVPEPAATPSRAMTADDVAPPPVADPAPQHQPQLDDAPRRSVVETLLSTPDAAPADVAPRRRDTREELTLELPRVEAPRSAPAPAPAEPRPVPAAGSRGPATDW